MSHEPSLDGQDWRAAFANSSDRLVAIAGELATMRAWPWLRRLVFLVTGG